MRRKIIASAVILLFLFIMSFEIIPLDIAGDLKDYYLENYIEETGSRNAVTAIYLDYRLFDTIFETLLLLVSVIGIIYFSRHEGDY